LFIQTVFSSPLHHLSMFLCLPLYVLEWLGFTFNHAAPKQDKCPCPSNLFMLQSICPHNPPNQGKSSNCLLSSSHLSATQNLRWVQPMHLHFSKCPNKLSKVIQVEWVTSKNFHALGTFAPIILPTPTNNPPEYLSHRTIIFKSPRCALPHPMSHTKGKWTPPKSLGIRFSHSGWLPTILGWIFVMIVKSSHDSTNLAKVPHPSSQTRHVQTSLPTSLQRSIQCASSKS
jgi:hypothetical protein